MKAHVILIAVLAICASGCFAAIPTVPVTPENQAKVSACEQYAGWHNAMIVTATVLSGGTATMGTIETQVSDSTARQDLGFAILGTGVAVGAATLIAGLEGKNYAASGCQELTGPLPLKPAPKPVVWVDVPSPGEVSMGAK